MTDEKSPDYMLGMMAGDIKAIRSSVEHTQASLVRTQASLDSVEERLRKVEQRSAIIGFAAGGVMSVAIELIVSKMKALGL